MSLDVIVFVCAMGVAGVWVGVTSSKDPLEPMWLGLMGLALGCILCAAE